MTTTDYPATGPLAPAAQGTLKLVDVRPYGEGEPVTVLVEDGVIVDLDADRGVATDHTVDGGGHVLLPGVVDIHVHLREPGREDTETVITGSQAAAKGGFPAPFVAQDKYWPPVNRIDHVAGDRNLVCACPPIESYMDKAA